MENKLKLSSKLSFRGWPRELVAELLQLEAENEELKLRIKELLDEHRTRTKENRGSLRNDPQPPKQKYRSKPKA